MLFKLLLVNMILAESFANEIDIDAFEPHSDFDPNHIDYGTLRVAKKGRNLFVLLGDFKTIMNWGNELIMTIVITNVDHNLQMYKHSKGICDFIKDEPKFYAALQKQSNLPPMGVCPLPKGDYKIDNYKVPIELLPPAPSGKYMMKVTFSVDGKNVAGYTMRTTLKP